MQHTALWEGSAHITLLRGESAFTLAATPEGGALAATLEVPAVPESQVNPSNAAMDSTILETAEEAEEELPSVLVLEV